MPEDTPDHAEHALQSWWLALSDDHQDEARRLVDGDPAPGWLSRELRAAGVPQATTWWPETEAGRELVPVELVQFIDDQDPEDRSTH
jgi:hypothetical protein